MTNKNENLKNIVRPLADKMRPRNFNEFAGQEHIVGHNKILRRLIESSNLSSVIFWGPPGTGKTTLANIVANMMDAEFIKLSGVMSGKKELKEVIDNARFSNKKLSAEAV